jgi:hypothetical protein
MTPLGLLHLGSMIYLSGIICVAVSVNENTDPKVIVKETLRRWIKFLGLTFAIALVVQLLSC